MRLAAKFLLFLLCATAVFAQVPPVQIITSSPLQPATLSTAYGVPGKDVRIAATGGDGEYLWSIVTNQPGCTGTLPPGLFFDTSNGFEVPSVGIIGTPTSSGTFTFCVRADPNNETQPAPDTEVFTLVVNPLPTIITNLPNASTNQLYSHTLTTTGGTPPFNWALLSGTLPTGCNASSISSGGVFSCTPTQTGTFNFTIITDDYWGRRAIRAYTVTWFGITNVNPNSGQQGTNNLNVAITGSFTNWSQGTTSVNLGAGITVNSVTVSSATSLTANISIAAGAAVGARNLTVTTGSEVVSLANAFTVTAGTPVITSVNPNTGQQGANNLNVAIAGQFTNWVQGTTLVNLGAGITVNSVTVSSATSLTANISIAAGAALGARNLTVTTGSQVVSLANAFTVTAGTPVITSVNPNTGQQGTNNLNVAIAGQFTNWAQGTTSVNLGAGITVNSVTVSSATSLTANISIAASAAVGARNLTVTTGSEVVSLANAFTVTAGTPVITSVNPNTGQQGANNLNVAIASQFTNWAQGTTSVNLGAGITVNSVTVSSGTSLTANISIAAGAAVGARNLTVTTGSEVVSLANAFTVTAGTPVITSVNPNTGQQGANIPNVAIAGQFTNWAQGTTSVNLGAGITVNAVTVNSPTSLTANISIAVGAAAGARNLTVTTGSEVVNLANAFTVTAGTPVITSVNPNTGQQGTNNLNVAIAGQFSNWVQGTTAVNLGAGITVNSVTVSSSTSLTANISIAGSAAAGARTLTVTTGSEVVNLANAFTVTAGTPVITSVNPNTGQQGTNNLNVAITGQFSNWVQGTTAVNLGAGITVNSVTVSNPTSLTANISIAGSAAAGARNLTVTTGSEVVNLANAFTVTAGTPVITSVNPNSGQQGTNNLNVAIAGQFTNWVQGTTSVTLGAGITVNSVTVSSATSLTANISIAAGAAAGVRTLTVTTGSEVVNLASAFTVTAGTRVITSVNPNSGQQGTNNLNVAIAGQFTSWAQGTTSVNLGAGITVNSVTVSSPTSLTANITIAANAVAGARNLTVTTGSEVVNLANAFTVTDGTPVITQVNPNSGQQGTNNLNVAITGQFTNWVQGATAVDLGAGITVNSVTVSSATSLTANISIAGNAAGGARNLTVSTGSEVVNLTNAFTVTAGTPVITSVNPNTGQQGTNNLNVAIAGQFTNWVQGTTQVSLGAGITVNSVTVNSATSLTTNISIVGNAASGARNLTVTTGSEVVNLTNAFTVTAGTPVITSVDPSTGQQGTNLSVAIAGQFTNWVQGTTTLDLGAGITVNSVTVNSATSLTAGISIAASAAIGARNLTVSTGSEIVNRDSAFIVTPGTPVITSVNPNTAQLGMSNLSVTITALFTNWVPGTTIVNLGSGITLNSVVVNSPGSLTVNISIAPNATVGARNVSVPTGQEIVNLANGFTVTDGTPVITGVNPNTGQQGTSNLNVAITGMFTNWDDEASVVNFGPGIIVNSVGVSSPTSLTANISIAANAAVGGRTLTVSTDSEVVNLADAFMVTAGTPVITQVTPNMAQQGINNLSVAIAGQFTNWVQGTTTVSLGAGITVNSVVVNSSISLTANVSIAGSAAPGARNLTVSTGQETVNALNAFTVTAGQVPTPAIISISPNTSPQGANNLNVAISGMFTNWAQGSTAVNLGAGITVNSVTVSSPTSLTANISIASNAPGGARNLMVTTGAEVVSVPNGFMVTAAGILTITTPSSLPNGATGVPYSVTFSVSGGTPPYTWSLTGGSLPSGLTLSSAGVLSGTPGQTGSFNFSVTVTDSPSSPITPFTGGNGQLKASGSASFSLTIGSGLQITTTALPAATAGVPYSATLAATGGISPYTWSIQSGSLPPGLTISSAGVISGTPSVSSPVQFEAKVTDSIGSTATKSFAVTVQPIALEITTQTIPNGVVGVAYSTSFNAAGGDPPYSWSLQNTDIPGFSMSNTGELRGTPTVAGTYSVNVLVRDQANTSSGKQFRLVIAAQKLEITTGSLPNGVVGASYSTSVSASGGLLPYVWASAGLPGGLSMNSAGAISGTPTAPGTFQVSVTVTDAERNTATKDFSVRIVAPLQITTPSPIPPGTVAAQYSVGFAVSGGLPPYRWSGSGPGGLALSQDGVLSGRPTTAGRPEFEITVTDSENRTTAKQFSLEIFPELIFVTQSPLPRATVGVPYATTISAAGGRPPYRFSGSGEAGLSIDVNGAISGTPGAPGNFTFQIEVTDSGSVTTARTFDIVVGDPLMVTTSSLPNGTLGSSYSASLSASGGRAPLSWSVSTGSLPAGLSVSSGGAITGTPTAPGTSTFTVTVTDADNQTASRQLSITIIPPPVSGGTVTGIPANPQPQTQLNLNVVLPAPYPLDLTLTLTLTFASEVGGDDQTIQFSTGGRTATLIIPAGQTQAPSTVGVQTGTVAGTITITAVVRAAGMDVTPQPPPRATITIPRGVPVLTSLQIQRTATGLNLTVIGYTVTRSATQAALTLEPASGANLQTTTIPVNVAAVFDAYFATAAANTTGGQFRLVLPLTINGDQTAIRSISMTLANSSGTSQPASAVVP